MHIFLQNKFSVIFFKSRNTNKTAREEGSS